jgi:putative ABC transport system permease protein
MTYLMSTRQDASTAAAAVRSAIWKVDPAQPLFDIRTMQRVMYEDLAGTYLVTALMGAFGVVALAVAAFGIFGVFSHAVSQRRAEMGIRLALGAIPNQLVAMVVFKALRLCAIGIVIGLIAGWAAGNVIGGVLYNVSALDPLTFLATAGSFAAVGALACYLPARRAAKVDPITALRYE